MKTKKAMLFVSAFLTVILLLALTNIVDRAILGVYASGTPDAYGDRIFEVSVWQNNIMKGNITYDNYTLGVQVKVDALTTTRFNCTVKLNSTFASSTAEAMTNTRVYINITYTNGTVIISTTEMTDYAATGPTGDYYYVKSYYTWDDSTHHPIAGVTYYVWFSYEVYR